MEEKGRGRDLRKKIGRKTNKKEENRGVGKKKQRGGEEVLSVGLKKERKKMRE
jgi:hypothetical protein